MKKVVGVRFKKAGKIYYFAPGDLEIHEGDYVIVETSRGPECGEVAQGIHEIIDAKAVKGLKNVVRIADDVDIRRMKKTGQPPSGFAQFWHSFVPQSFSAAKRLRRAWLRAW